MVDVKKLWIWVHTTGVKKGWDWVELPDGRMISVPEGKYVKVMKIGNKTAIGFEDLTEEIGEKPDWDYQTPMCIVDEEVDGVQKTAKLRCKFTGRYHVSLFYEGSKVAEFWWGKTFDAPSFSYVDVQALAQQLQIAPAPAVPAMPAFDYIVDIYSDKVVITASDGSTTTLNTISDFNNWLKNVRGKKIRINTYVVVTQDLDLTSNEYWIFGEWIRANVNVIEPNISIYSFAPLGSNFENLVVGNYIRDASTGKWIPVDASNLKIFAVHADIIIENPSSSGYMPVSIYVMNSSYVCLVRTIGDVVANTIYITLDHCVLMNTEIYTGYLYMDSCVAGATNIKIVSRITEYINNVNFDNAKDLLLSLGFVEVVTVNANSRVYISLPPKTGTDTVRHVYIEQIGVPRSYWSTGYVLSYVLPLPSGVSYDVDGPMNSIVITNNTGSVIDVRIVYRVAEGLLV